CSATRLPAWGHATQIRYASSILRGAHAMNLAVLVAVVVIGADEPKKPLFATVDLDRGETVEVRLADGSNAKVKLVEIKETRDSLREALRRADVTVEINGRTTTLTSGNYRLPVLAGGVQVDCPATKGLYPNHDTFEDSWGLDKDARLRLRPEKSAWMEPGTFV